MSNSSINSFNQGTENLHSLIKKVQTSYPDLRATLMEVCGTHTNAIRRAGIHRMLPSGVRLLSGPGCPVCVTGSGFIEQAIRLSHRPRTIVASFGDLLKVPGNSGTLSEARAAGGAIRIVYSPLDAVNMARENPDREVVFLGVGFETTAPTVALAIREAMERKLANFSVLTAFKILDPALRCLLKDQELQINGLIAPGHLAVILGANAFTFLPAEFRLPTVVTGFQPVEIWRGIGALLNQIAHGEARLENAYAPLVSPEGNIAAQRLLADLFTPEPAEWRGLGAIDGSGLGLRDEYRKYDAASRFGLMPIVSQEPPGCQCGRILLGKAEPEDCVHFGRSCTPEKAIGPCMVSAEGTCAAHFSYRGFE
ncbi:MAG TPA: hydrogenase formation protein HypD [Bacillota bacterium]